MILNTVMNIFPLFASNVFVCDLEEDLQSLQNLKKIDFLDTSSEGSYKSFISKDLNVLNKFPKVKNIIKKHFNQINNEILMYNDINFEITTSWATKLCKNSYSQYHNHMNCFYSGILYFDEYDENSGSLQFETPFQTQQLSLSSSGYNIFNSKVYSFRPQKNILIFFPNYLRHRITTHLSDFDRYSLAFNLMPTGKFGIRDSFINLSLRL